MDNLVHEIEKFKDEIEKFIGDFKPKESLFSPDDIEFINSGKNDYEKNIRLKQVVEKSPKANYKDEKLNSWIIKDWGGIHNFNTENQDRIRKFKLELDKGLLTKKSFETISSLSKLSAFYEPKKYIIYDSRVVFTLNWLLLKTNNTQYRFFPMPESRNTDLKKYDLSTLINLINSDKETDKLYFNEHEAYFKLCELVKKLSERVFEDNKYPYYLEMLLFQIAAKEILAEIKAKVKVTIG